MSDISKNEILKQVNNLFKQAEVEYQRYNWNLAIEILKKIEKISQKENIKDILAQTHYKLAEIYQVSVDFQNIKEDVLKNFKLSIENYQTAHNIYIELKNKLKIKECLAFINFLKFLSEVNKEKEFSFLKAANEYFHELKLIYLKNGNTLDSLKMEVLESRTLGLTIAEKIIRNDEKADFKELTSTFENITKRIWEEMKWQQKIPEICIYQFLVAKMEYSALGLYLPIEKLKIKDYLNHNFEVFKDFLKKFENSEKAAWLFYIYSLYSLHYFLFAAYFANNQFEQKKFLRKSQKWIKKGEELLQKNNAFSALEIFYYTRYSTAMFLISIGFFAKEFKYVLEDLYDCIKAGGLYFPRIIAAHQILYAPFTFMLGALGRSTLNMQKMDFANRIIEIMTNNVDKSMTNPIYVIHNLFYKTQLCAGSAILGDTLEDTLEDTKKSQYLKQAAVIFKVISNYIGLYENTYNYGHIFLFTIPRVGLLLAKNSSNKAEKINYYQKALNFLLKTKNTTETWFYIDNLFLIGDVYLDLGSFTNDEEILKKSISAYMDAIQYCSNKGFFSLVGSGHINLAQIEDRLGNYIFASENYEKAIQAFKKALLTLTYIKAGKNVERLIKYVEAWSIIEIAKSQHEREEHVKAQENYEQASKILSTIREFKYESPFYGSWSILEKAENLSKENIHKEASETYLIAKSHFEKAIETLNSFLKKRTSPEDIERIRKLIKVGEVRKNYCTARQWIEIARIESKMGNHLQSAELYNKAGSLFEDICEKYRMKKERDELTGILYLCKAWENMEKGELKQDSSLFAIASYLFKKASNIFSTNRMKKLSLGNSIYCSALENRILWSKTADLGEKTDFYKKIKIYLRESSKNYQLGGFKEDAKWALATSTYFDGIWHLIQADNELDFTIKNQYLNIATNYFNTAINIFDEVGSKQMKKEIADYLKMVTKERAIITSATKIIQKPAISESSVGISAPSCPIEISSSVNIEEMQKTDLQTESENNWHKRVRQIYLFLPNDICIYNHLFKPKIINGEKIEVQFISNGLIGISKLLQEVTKSKTKVKIIEQEELSILIEYGKFLIGALITEENLITLRNKLIELIQEVEEFYKEEFENFQGDLRPFAKIDKFVQKIFKK